LPTSTYLPFLGKESPPTGFRLRTVVTPASALYPHRCRNPSLTTRIVNSLGGIHPSRSSAQGDNCSEMARPLICMREKIQLTLSSHSRPYGWSYFTAQESLATLVISPWWTFPVQWDLHHTLTMVPLPTFLGQQPLWLLTTKHIHSRKTEPLLLMQS
jgi:hypothetical protein